MRPQLDGQQLLPVLCRRSADLVRRAWLLQVSDCQLLRAEPAGVLRQVEPECRLLRAQPGRLLRDSSRLLVTARATNTAHYARLSDAEPRVLLFV